MLRVPPEVAAAVRFTILSRAYTLALLLVLLRVDWALATVAKPLRILPRVGELLMKPMPPSHTSLAWLVVAVVPVAAAVLLPVALTVWSSELVARMPTYSMTTAAERNEDAWVMVRDVAAPDTFIAYQISVVVPLVLAAWAARDHKTPVWVMPVIRLALVPRVEMIATKVLPAAGGVVSDTLNELAELLPVLPVALCTRAAATPVETACAPTFPPARLAVPVNVRPVPSRLLVIDKTPAAANFVPSYG